MAAAMQAITTAHSRSRIKDLRHSGRTTTSTSEYDLDSGYSVWRRVLEDKRVTTGFRYEGVIYRVASDREQARTGKSWIAFRSPCEDSTGDVHKTLPLLVRTTRQAEAARMTTVEGREAAVHRFAFDGLADTDDPHAQEVTAWIRDHRVRGLTLVVTTGADDGELLGLRLKHNSMTTCNTPNLYCRSRTDVDGFGRPVAPRPAVPSDDEICWLPSSPPRHG